MSSRAPKEPPTRPQPPTRSTNASPPRNRRGRAHTGTARRSRKWRQPSGTKKQRKLEVVSWDWFPDLKSDGQLPLFVTCTPPTAARCVRRRGSDIPARTRKRSPSSPQGPRQHTRSARRLHRSRAEHNRRPPSPTAPAYRKRGSGGVPAVSPDQRAASSASARPAMGLEPQWLDICPSQQLHNKGNYLSLITGTRLRPVAPDSRRSVLGRQEAAKRFDTD